MVVLTLRVLGQKKKKFVSQTFAKKAKCYAFFFAGFFFIVFLAHFFPFFFLPLRCQFFPIFFPGN